MKSILDSRQLLAARILADTGSFTLTGQQLSLTQSAVSHAIKALEEEVECRLFNRSGKGVTVTPAGKHLLEYTDKILAEMEIARTLVTPRATRGRERLRLGMGSRIRESILPVVRPSFDRDFPNRLIVIDPGEYRRNLELLGSELLDISFIVRPTERPDLEYVHLFEDELRFIVSPDHPWARSGRAAVEDLARDSLLLFQEFNNTTKFLARHMEAERITPRHGVELPDIPTIKMLVRTGRAVGVMAPWLASKELQEGSLVSLSIGTRPLIRHWGLAYLRKRRLTPMEMRWIELCRQAVPGLLSRLQGPALPSHQKKDAAAAPLSETVIPYSPAVRSA